MNIYLAGPEVFDKNAILIGQMKKSLCTSFGFNGLFPMDNEIRLNDSDPVSSGMKIFKENVSMMDISDIGIFNLTPFRGPSADAGTVFELGYMFAKGKKCFAYSQSKQLYTDRAKNYDHWQIEDFSMFDNLMVSGPFNNQISISERNSYDFSDLSGFYKTLEIIKNTLV